MIRRSPQRILFLASIGLFVVAVMLSWAVYPFFQSASYSVDGAESVDRAWPFSADSASQGIVTWEIPLRSPLLLPGSLALYGTGHLHEMTINGETTNFVPPKVLSNQTPTRVLMNGHLKSEDNILGFSIEKPAGRVAFRLTLDPSAASHLILLAAFIASFACALLGLHFHYRRAFPIALATVLLLGISIRILYTSATLYSARSYDTPGHVQYIKYVAEKGTLPPPLLGWETHQPPLYYAINAGIMRFLGMESNSSLYASWQFLSLLLGIGAFLLCYPIGIRLLGKPDENPWPHAVFLSVLAVYPGFIFTASRLSNDSLFNFLAFLWFWLIIRAWQEPSLKRWSLVAFCLGVGMLTKNTTLPLIAVSVCLIAVQRLVSFQRKGIALGMLAAIIVIVCGWYQIPRLTISDSPTAFIAANNDMGPGLRLPRSLERMATFNPIKVIEIPFLSTWRDETRRMFLAEAFFKSSLFGEWVWGDHLLLPARALVVCTLALLVCATAGFVLSLRSRDPNFVPLFLTAGAVFGSLLVYFWKLPFACNQDFRFAVLLLVPMAFWVARATRQWPRCVGIIVGLFAIHSIIFLGLLCYL